MFTSVKLRRLVSGLLAVLFVFSQLVVAVHACELPGVRSTQTQPPCPDDPQMSVQPDTELRSKLCETHCAQGHSVDQPTPSFSAATALPPRYPIPPQAPPLRGLATRTLAGAAAMAQSPPHSILHCCLRT